ncbi:glutaredoxin-c11 [Phtheirospermum japonicum]|uniref:Glutaredoxin-c11 n=1 Tax=Phtheirospermum japonicum TaxID=374723 RepID=A0A830D843_9LAMI|nr:glutaredoxin-c11 [Phtheirospermum japonicum]
MDRIRDLASKKAAVIFTKSSCCMCHSIKALFYDLGASPAVHELDHDVKGKEMEQQLERALGVASGRRSSFPAVFIGRELVGGADEVMSLHVKGELVPLLKKAKAIWL